MPLPEPPPIPVPPSAPSVADLRALLQSFKNDDLSTLSSLQYVLAVLLDYTYSLPVESGIAEVTASAPLTSSGGDSPDISLTPGTVSGEVIAWNGSSWTNAAPSVTGITELGGDVIAGPGTGLQNATVSGIEGIPVDATPPVLGQVLGYNGVWWTPTTPTADTGITELTGDVTAGPGSGSQVATVTALQGNPVSTVLPVDGQVLTWNGDVWVPGAPAAGGSGGGGQTYFLNAGTLGNGNTSGLPGVPLELGLVAETSTTPVVKNSLPTGGTYAVVAGFVTKSGVPDLTAIPAGVWDFNVWAQSSAPQPNTTSFRLKVYSYNDLVPSPPVLIAIGEPTPLYDPSQPIQYVSSVLLPQTSITAADRIYVEIEATAKSSGHSITVNFGGSTPTHTHTTLPSVAGTGIVHVVDGVVQSPASPVDLTAGPTEISGTLPISNGGTGLTAPGASGNIIVSNGTTFASVTLSKDGTLDSAGQLTVTGVQGTQFSSTPPTANQLMQYDAGTGQWTPATLESVLQTTYTAIYATENISRGDVVVATNAGGSPAGYIAVAKANAAVADLSFPVVGISNDDLTTATLTSRLGNAVITGLITGIDTHLLVQRRPAYIDTTSGKLTSTKPLQPNYVFQVGYCIDQSGAAPPFTGAFWVSPQSVINTQNLKDVTAAAPVENDLLIYKSATSLWTSGPLLKVSQTQTAVNLNAGNTITNAMIANVVYLPIKTNAAITLGANPIDVLTANDYGRQLWLHNVSTGGGAGARNITFLAGGTTWLEGGVNLVLPANTIAKFMWLNVGGGAGRWVQTEKAITSS